MSTATKDSVFTTTAGPIQTKKVNAAIHGLLWRGRTRVELRGMVGGEERRAELTQPFSPPCEDATAALNTVAEQFGRIITRENYAEIVTALELATRNLVLPVDDCRTTADEVAQRTAERAKRDQEQAAERDASESAYNAILAKRPAAAEALIVAVFDQDDSDSMSDYHNHKITRVVAIGWRRGKREDFKQLRAAAALFPETAHLGPDADASVEHRENWSMGSGNYVKAGHDDSTGWRVKSQDLSFGWVPPVVIEDRLTTTAAVATSPATSPAAPAGAAVSGKYTVEKHYHTKRAFDMWIVILADRVERPEFERLRASCEAADGWYSRAWGKTPGGFAFKSPEAANAWAGSIAGEAAPVATPSAEPAATGSNPTAARLRTLADGMTAGIEQQRRPMTQNPTPKRMREYNSRRLDGDNAERCQRALYALADAHDAGTVPPILASLKSKSQIGPMVAHGTASSSYYDVHSTGEYRDTSPAAVALQELMEGNKTAADVEADAKRAAAQSIQQLEESLRFTPIEGFFPTPRPVIDLMIERAELEPEHTILEPSAGKGDIADAIMEQLPNASVKCIEIVMKLREILVAKGYDVKVGGDFLDHTPLRPWDRILMNPPFEKGQDADHIRHAFECLAPGGRMVALCSSGPFFRNDGKSQAFREWIQDVNALVEDVSANSFNGSDAFRRTGVSIKMLVITKSV